MLLKDFFIFFGILRFRCERGFVKESVVFVFFVFVLFSKFFEVWKDFL